MPENPREFDRLWDYRDPAATESRFREVLGELAEAPELALELLTQIARAQGLQGKFAAAHETLDRVAERLSDAPVAEVRLLLERGRVFRSAGEPQRAIPLFEAALERAERLGAEFHEIDAAHMLGISSAPDEALRWNHRAIERAHAARDPRARGWLGALLNNTAWLHHDRGELDVALSLFERALEFRRARGAVRERRIAEWCVARCFRSLGRHEDALARQRGLRAEVEADPEASDEGFIAEEIGECLWELGRAAEARPFLREAAERLAADGSIPRERIERLRVRGEDPTGAQED